jgi:hypothetical protein
MQYVPHTARNNAELNWYHLEDEALRLINQIELPEFSDDLHWNNIGLDEHHHIKVLDYGEEMYDVSLDLKKYTAYFKQKDRQFKRRKVQKALAQGVCK